MARDSGTTTAKTSSKRPLPHGLSTQLSPHSNTIAEYAGPETDNETSNDNQQALSITKVVAGTAIVKKAKSSPVKLGITPFPNYARPTREEAYEVHRILTEAHGRYDQPDEPNMPSATVAGCGDVPFILEAVIRTIISAATSMENANTAIRGLLQRFRVFKTGSYAGSVDWNQVRLESRQDLIKALPGGVMPGMKAKFIHNTLQAVWEENNLKREQLRATMSLTDTTTTPSEEVDGRSKDELVRAAKLTEMSNKTLLEHPNILTLDYMHAWDDADVFYGLQRYMGVGPKIAACVMLFCMQRPRFAVDTHCHRLCKWLGWVPNHQVNDQKTFAHCDVRIPDELKFSLHQLMIVHGKDCKSCNAKDLAPQADDPECPLEHLLNRERQELPRKKVKIEESQAAAAVDDTEEEDEDLDLRPTDPALNHEDESDQDEQED